MITTKNKKETAKELAHTDIYHDGTYIGYVIRNHSKFAAVNENWNFVGKHGGMPSLHDKTKKALIEKINLHISK